jgi:hypothetical protein
VRLAVHHLHFQRPAAFEVLHVPEDEGVRQLRDLGSKEQEVTNGGPGVVIEVWIVRHAPLEDRRGATCAEKAQEPVDGVSMESISEKVT